MQFALNNTFSLAIGKALNIINLLSAKTTKKTIEILDYKIQVSDAIAIGIMLAKH
jgi:hypothetical protein